MLADVCRSPLSLIGKSISVMDSKDLGSGLLTVHVLHDMKVLAGNNQLCKIKPQHLVWYLLSAASSENFPFV